MEISNTQDIIDSRDIIEKIEEIEDEIECMEEDEILDYDEYYELKKEFRILKELEEEASGSPCWNYGETLIHENYFEEYVEEFLKDIGDLPQNIPWYIEIDWGKTAENLKADYFEVSFDGETYYIKA